MKTCGKLRFGWKLVASLECCSPSASILALYFGERLSGLMWKWEGKNHGKNAVWLRRKGRSRKKIINSYFVASRGTDKVICIVCKQEDLVLEELLMLNAILTSKLLSHTAYDIALLFLSPISSNLEDDASSLSALFITRFAWLCKTKRVWIKRDRSHCLPFVALTDNGHCRWLQ